MTEQFHQPPEIPRATNVHGEPSPPSGTHTPIDTEASIKMIGSEPHPVPSSEPAKNIHA